MKIVHFSDWHSVGMMVPKADLYICTGDMMLNFPVTEYELDRWDRRRLKYDHNAKVLGMKPEPGFALSEPGGFQRGYRIVRDHEEIMQARWVREVLGSWRQYLASPDAPVVCVRGNHDFVSLAESFGGDVWEVDDDPSRTIEFGGLKIGGLRGVNTINGWWNDETTVEEFDDRIAKVPKDVDVLLSHTAPANILDKEGAHWGSPSIRRFVEERLYSEEQRKLLHCFGHIHAQHSVMKEGIFTFSNAATGFNVIEV